MLEIKDLTFCYPHRSEPVLNGLSLSIGCGGVYGLLGKNGAGKSTLLYLIAGLLTPKSGSVELFGKNTRLRCPDTLASMFIVPEEFDLPAIKLSQYVKLKAPFYPNFSLEDMRRHLSTFEMDPDMNLGALSMGQKKKAFMSFALACNTPLMLMDEPTNGLDIPGKASFRRFIASCMTDERSIIISTHQVRDINRLLDNVIIMNNSSILLNQSVGSITDKLAFTVSDRPQDVAAALYAQPSIQGTSLIVPNTDHIETEIDLETLFELATTRPEAIREIFTTAQTEAQ